MHRCTQSDEGCLVGSLFTSCRFNQSHHRIEWLQFGVRVDEREGPGLTVSIALRSLRAEGYQGESGNFVRGSASVVNTFCFVWLIKLRSDAVLPPCLFLSIGSTDAHLPNWSIALLAGQGNCIYGSHKVPSADCLPDCLLIQIP